MAKVKIADIAKELGRENKEILNYLQSQGVESAKVWNSSVEEADADKARQHFGGQTAEKKEEKAPAQEAAPEKKAPAAVDTPVVKAESAPQKTKTPEKAEKAEKPQAASDKKPAKKKKNIIFVSNPGNSSTVGGGYQGQQSARGGYNNSGRGVFARSQNVYHPIKPLTAPSQLDSYNVDVPKYEEKPAPKKEEEVKAAPAKPAEKSAEKPAPETKPQAQAKEKDIHAAGKTSEPAHTPVKPQDTQSGERKPSQGQRPAPSVAPHGGTLRNGERPQRPSGGFGTLRPAPGTRPGQAMRPGQGGGYPQNTNRGGYPGGAAPAPGGKPGGDKRRQGQERDKRKKDKLFENEEQMSHSKKAGRFIKPEVKKEETPEEVIKVITLPEKLTIKELAEKMKMAPSAIIKKLFMAGQIVTVNSELTYEEAENIAIDYDIICEKEVQVDVIEELLKEEEEDPGDLVPRPPVVVVMGHVDHGKTSLLDAIRKTSVTEKEAGGITQRIGAYQVSVGDRRVTFLDTPGHEAFTAMRMRGANSTDIAVLVVAADDGVMPQTVEAINHAKAANVEIIVAVNKIDKPGANIDRVKQEMTEHGLIATDWGGQTEFVPVSAKTGEGMDALLDTILLTADILELKANPNREARGLVLEARLDKGRGPVANVLVQKGTLHVGDFISAGASSGRVRAMVDDKGRRLKEATPSQPVEILGLGDVPSAGEVFLGHSSDKEAKQYANTYLQQHKKDLIEEAKASKSKMSLDDLYSKIEEGKLKELNIIIKADVQGSVEALKQSLLKLSGDEVVVKIIHGGVGAITESDVSLAAASDAIIIGFDVRPDAMAKSIAEHEGVEIKLYKVIYQAIDDVEYALKGMLAPVYEEKITGHVQVRQLFKASRVGNIAGSMVTDGVIQKDSKVRVKRGGEVVFEGELSSLKRFKDDVKEVREGYECGLVIDGFDEIQVDDEVEAYIMVEVPREKLENQKKD